MSSNTVECWNRLLLFSPICLRHPRRRKHTESLSSLVKRQLQDDLVSPASVPSQARGGRKRTRGSQDDPEIDLAKRVAIKIEEGDFRGAIRLASSDDSLADFSDDTYAALCAKHPPASPDSRVPSQLPDVSLPECVVSSKEVCHAIRSFPCGSAGGPDKLRPQHLKDLLQHVGEDDLESPFLSALVAFAIWCCMGRPQWR